MLQEDQGDKENALKKQYDYTNLPIVINDTLGLL